MKKVKRLFSSEIIFYSIITIVLLVIAIFPLYRKFALTPPGHIYTLAQVRIADFYIYQAVMGQGVRGHWLVEHPFVNEPHQRTLVYFYFIILGKLASILGISNPIMYFLAIYANLIGLIASVLWLLKTIFPKKKYLQASAFLLIFFTGTWQRLSLASGKLAFIDDWSWNLQWSSVYHRLIHVPHHTLAEIFLIISVILLIRFWRDRKLIWALIAGILQTISAIIFPAPTLILVFAVVITIYFLMMSKGLRKSGGIKTIGGVLLFVLLSIVPLLLFRSQLGSGYPWNLERAVVKENHLAWSLGMDIDYLLMFGPLIIFIPFAFNRAVFTNFSKMIIWFLFLSPLILIPLVPFIGIPSWRVVTAAPFVWAGILAAFGVKNLFNLAHHYSKFNPRGWFWIVVAGILLVSAPQAFFYWWREAQPLFQSQIYIPQAGMEAIEILDRKARESDVVLSLQHLGIFIPAVTRAKGFMAVPPWTYKLNKKFAATRAFYNGEMSKEEALNFLQKNNIKFVFIGWDEKAYWQKIPYDFLEEIYNKEGIILYRVSYR